MARGLAQRRDRLLSSLQAQLDGTSVTWAGSGTHALLRLNDIRAGTTDAFIDHAVRCGVRLYNAAPYYLCAPPKATLLCGFATLSLDEIQTGVERLARALTSFA